MSKLRDVSDIHVGDILKSPAIWYVFKTDYGAVFLDRMDNPIKKFQSYIEAIQWAEKNLHLINEKEERE